jgi:hypothetical protein
MTRGEDRREREDRPERQPGNGDAQRDAEDREEPPVGEDRAGQGEAAEDEAVEREHRPDTEPKPAPEPPGETPTIVAILLAAAAVVAAVIGARAASVGDEGSDTYHSSIRQDVKAGAALVEDVRFVYQEEAALAFQVAESIARSQESRLQAQESEGLAKSLLESDAGSQEGVVKTLRGSSDLAFDPKYEVPGGGYEVLERLADVRAENPDLVAIDADSTEERATDMNFESALLIATTVPAALAFLCGALANGFPSARRWLVPVGFALTGLSLILALIVELTH